MRDAISSAPVDAQAMDAASTDAPPATGGGAGTERRDFLQQLLTAGAAVAGVGLLTGCAATAGATTGAAAAAPGPAAPTSPGPRAPAPQSPWDMSWTQRLGRYKTAYDSPEIQHGAALHFAVASTSGYKSAMGATDAEITPVLILRHTASVMVLEDAMWKRLALGERHSLKDPTTGEPALRNPFINYKQGDRHSTVGASAALDALLQRGAIVLTCNNALMGVAYQLRQKETGLTQETAMAEVRRAVLPGVYVMPNGIFAVSAAQDAGCHYMRVLV